MLTFVSFSFLCHWYELIEFITFSHLDMIFSSIFIWYMYFLEVKAAFELLGYNKKIWDGDLTPSTDDYDWDELSKEQQNAAKMLGYNKNTWDAEE